MGRVCRGAAGGQASPLGEAPERSEGEGEQDVSLEDKVPGESDKGRISPLLPAPPGASPQRVGSLPLAVGFRLLNRAEDYPGQCTRGSRDIIWFA